MKQFFESYGAVAFGILALLVLIAMITPVGNIIKTSLQGTVQTFSTKIDGQTDTMTESMSVAFTNAVDFTGAKGGKYYVHGQVVSDTTLSDGESVGTLGYLLSEAQYNLLKTDYRYAIGSDDYFIFIDGENLERVIICEKELGIGFSYSSVILYKNGNVSTQSYQIAGINLDYNPDALIQNNGYEIKTMFNELWSNRSISALETLNIE